MTLLFSEQKEKRTQVRIWADRLQKMRDFLISHFYDLPYSKNDLFLSGLMGNCVNLISPVNTVLTLLWWLSGHPCWLAAIRLAQVSTRECYTRAPEVDFPWMRPLSLKCWNLEAMQPLPWASGTLGSGQTGHFFQPGRGLTSTSASPTPTTWCDGKLGVSPLLPLFKLIFIYRLSFLGTLSESDLFPSGCKVFRVVWFGHCDCPTDAQWGDRAAASELPRSGEGLQWLCKQFYYHVSQEDTAILPLLFFSCKRKVLLFQTRETDLLCYCTICTMSLKLNFRTMNWNCWCKLSMR